jgi:hypothetical protein
LSRPCPMTGDCSSSTSSSSPRSTTRISPTGAWQPLSPGSSARRRGVVDEGITHRAPISTYRRLLAR